MTAIAKAKAKAASKIDVRLGAAKQRADETGDKKTTFRLEMSYDGESVLRDRSADTDVKPVQDAIDLDIYFCSKAFKSIYYNDDFRHVNRKTFEVYAPHVYIELTVNNIKYQSNLKIDLTIYNNGPVTWETLAESLRVHHELTYRLNYKKFEDRENITDGAYAVLYELTAALKQQLVAALKALQANGGVTVAQFFQWALEEEAQQALTAAENKLEQARANFERAKMSGALVAGLMT